VPIEIRSEEASALCYYNNNNNNNNNSSSRSSSKQGVGLFTTPGEAAVGSLTRARSDDMSHGCEVDGILV